MKSFINFLPPWVETNLQPAFYDKQSGTCIQQTARMYAKVNQLVRAVNKQNETIADYINKFIELKDFVEDYFDNLDVQQEINNKLDSMVESGEMQQILAPYVNERIDELTDSVNDQIQTIDGKVTALASGSPAGVYATVSALTTADPDHTKIYLVTADGKWYYYANNAWTAGGTYQSTGVGEGEIQTNNFGDSVKSYPNMRVVTPTMTSDTYIRYYNNNFYGTYYVYLNSHASVSEEIEVKAGQIVQVSAKGYNGNVGIISVVDDTIDENNKYYCIMVRDDSSNVQKIYSWQAPMDCTIVVSSMDNGWGGYVTIFDSVVKTKDIELNKSEQPAHHNLIVDNDIRTPAGRNMVTWEIKEGDAEYPHVLAVDIDFNGVTGDSSNTWSYYCLRQINLSEALATDEITIAVDIRSTDGTERAVVGVLPNGSANINFTKSMMSQSLVITDLSNKFKRYYLNLKLSETKNLTSLQIGLIEPMRNIPFSASYEIRYLGYVYNAGIGEIASNPLTYTDQEYMLDYAEGEDLFGAFNKFGAIGDSLSSGVCVSNAGGTYTYPNLYEYSWGQFMAHKNGMTCINFSKGGLTTRSWLTDAMGYARLIADGNQCNAYTIALGVNDANNLGHDYVGSSADINISDPTQNADTFYGNYGKIISAVKSVQPKAKIFLFTIPETASQYGEFNEAIREIATLFDNVYLIDLASSKYIDLFNVGFIKQQRRVGHYNAIAYRYMAEKLYKILGSYMYVNASEFKQIEFIGTNYSYSS